MLKVRWNIYLQSDEVQSGLRFIYMSSSGWGGKHWPIRERLSAASKKEDSLSLDKSSASILCTQPHQICISTSMTVKDSYHCILSQRQQTTKPVQVLPQIAAAIIVRINSFVAIFTFTEQSQWCSKEAETIVSPSTHHSPMIQRYQMSTQC